MKRHLPAIAVVALLLGIGVLIYRSWSTARDASNQTTERASDDADAPSNDERADALTGGSPPSGLAPSGSSAAPLALASDPLFAFDPIDYDDVASSRARLAAEAGSVGEDFDPSAASVAHLLDMAALLGFVELQEQSPGPLHAQAMVHFENAAGAVIHQFGVGGYVAVGEIAWARFWQAGRALAPDALRAADIAAVTRTQAPALSAALQAHAWRQTSLVGAWMGGFRVTAQREGFLDERGRIDPTHEDEVHLLFRSVWSHRATSILRMERLLSPQEYIAFRRWQIESSALTPARKLQLLDAHGSKIAGDYDVLRARSILLVQHGDLPGALSAAQEAYDAAVARGASESARARLEQMRDALAR